MTGKPGEVLFAADRLRRAYGTGDRAVLALQDASLIIHAGDRIALTGRSGSGKSTLLHIIAGLDMPTGGSIAWPALGKRAELRPAKIAIMTQSPSLIPWLTVEENVALPLQLLGRRDAVAADRVLHALREFALDDLAAKLPEELSGGQAQRVALTRATVSAPILVLADEPTGQVDHATAGLLMEALFGWADRTGAGIVVATHDSAISRRFPVRLNLQHGQFDGEYPLSQEIVS